MADVLDDLDLPPTCRALDGGYCPCDDDGLMPGYCCVHDGEKGCTCG